MAKYHGKIGFITYAEIRPGVDEDIITEREYFGDVIRNQKRWVDAQQVLPNVQINNQISIVADQYANDNCSAIRYISWMGSRWEVTNVDVQHPRLILSIGGVYNGPTPGSTDSPGNAPGCGCNGKVSTPS